MPIPRSSRPFDDLATEWAEYAGTRLFARHRGTICLGRPRKLCVIFGNDGIGVSEDRRAQREVEMLRSVLDAAQIPELGFGVFNDYSWAMLVLTDRAGALDVVLRATWDAADRQVSVDRYGLPRILLTDPDGE